MRSRAVRRATVRATCAYSDRWREETRRVRAISISWSRWNLGEACDLVALWQALGDLLGGEIDVISEHGLSPHLRDRILSEAVPL